MTFEEFKNRFPHEETAPIAQSNGNLFFESADTAAFPPTKIALWKSETFDEQYFTQAREFELGKTFEHPYLMRYYESFAFGRSEYGVIEFFNGGNFDDFIASDPTPSQFEEAIKGILKAIQYLHENRSVHFDIRPENILIHQENEEVTVKLIGYGAGKAIVEGELEANQINGSLDFMAPEQIVSFGGNLRPNVDLWAVGVLIYRAFRDATPFFDQAQEASEIINSIAEGKLEAPDDIAKLPEPYQTIVQKCLVIDPLLRTQSAKELIDFQENYVPVPPDRLAKARQAYAKENYDEAFKIFYYEQRELALKDADALYALGVMCLEAKGTFNNQAQAKVFLQAAADLGETRATIKLADIQSVEKEAQAKADALAAQANQSAEPSKLPTFTDAIKILMEELRPKNQPQDRSREGFRKQIPTAQPAKRNNRLQTQIFRYVIVAGVSIMLTLVISRVIRGFLSNTPSSANSSQVQNDSTAQNPTTATTQATRDTVQLSPFDLKIKEIRTSVHRLGTVNNAQTKLKQGITLIEEELRKGTYTDKQAETFRKEKDRYQDILKKMEKGEKSRFWTSYIVGERESLNSVAKKHGIKIENIKDSKYKEIKQAPDAIFAAGTELRLDLFAALFFNHTVNSGENVAFIAGRYAITSKDLKKLNKLEKDVIQPGQNLRVYLKNE